MELTSLVGCTYMYANYIQYVHMYCTYVCMYTLHTVRSYVRMFVCTYVRIHTVTHKYYTSMYHNDVQYYTCDL